MHSVRGSHPLDLQKGARLMKKMINYTQIEITLGFEQTTSCELCITIPRKMETTFLANVLNCWMTMLDARLSMVGIIPFSGTCKTQEFYGNAEPIKSGLMRARLVR